MAGKIGYPELATVINDIQRNRIKSEDKALVCHAVQQYYKTLNSAYALVNAKKKEQELKTVKSKKKVGNK